MKNKIKEYLEKRGMSQRELAEAVHCTEVSMSRYVSGKREPKATLAIQIAQALNANVQDVFPGIDGITIEVNPKRAANLLKHIVNLQCKDGFKWFPEVGEMPNNFDIQQAIKILDEAKPFEITVLED